MLDKDCEIMSHQKSWMPEKLDAKQRWWNCVSWILSGMEWGLGMAGLAVTTWQGAEGDESGGPAALHVSCSFWSKCMLYLVKLHVVRVQRYIFLQFQMHVFCLFIFYDGTVLPSSPLSLCRMNQGMMTLYKRSWSSRSARSACDHMVETKLLDRCTWQNSDRSWGQVFESIIQCIYGCDGSGYTDNWGVWSSKSYIIANLVGNGDGWECASSHQNLLPNGILQVDMLWWASCHTCPLCVPRIWQWETDAFECGIASKVGMFF